MHAPSFSDTPQLPGEPRMRVHRAPSVTRRHPLGFFLAGGLLALFALTAGAATFTVNSTADIHDGIAGDGVCETAKDNHICTLRAAIEEANALDGADTIQLQPNATYLLSLTSSLGTNRSADLIIADSVSIAGAGIDSTIIDGNGMATGQRVLYIIACIRDVRDSMTSKCTFGSPTTNISGVTIRHGVSSTYAGGINSESTLNLDHARLSDNSTSDLGGAILSFKTLTISNSIIANNSTGRGGGGIYAEGSTTVSTSTISGNTAAGASNKGGGLYLLGPDTFIVDSTISGNSAGVGGGIYHQNASVTVINTTISGNTSTGSGGGIYNSGGVVGLYNVTVTENGANSDETGFDAGGGVYNAASGTAMYVSNSIISGNTLVIPTAPFPTLASDECGGTITSFGYNILVSVDTSHCTVSGPYTSADPLLGPLQLNGGLTQTHALSIGSPAIDGGNPSGCTDQLGAPITTDQRGIHRPYGTNCDIGAFEWADIIFRNGFQAP